MQLTHLVLLNDFLARLLFERAHHILFLFQTQESSSFVSHRAEKQGGRR